MEPTRADKLRMIAGVLDMYDDFARQMHANFGRLVNWEGFPLDFTNQEDNYEMQRELRAWADELDAEGN